LTADPDKLPWGKQNFGVPARDFEAAIAELKSSAEFASVRFDAIEYYCDRLLFRCLPEEIDAAVSTDEIQTLDPNVTKVVLILLLRDFIRRYQDRLVPKDFPQNWVGQWVEKFTARLLELTGAPVQPYVEWILSIPEGEQEDPRPLIVGLAKQIGLEPGTLWQLHTGMCEVAEEDLLSGQEEPKSKPPWWKFWS
jgi:hypothetical protein